MVAGNKIILKIEHEKEEEEAISEEENVEILGCKTFDEQKILDAELGVAKDRRILINLWLETSGEDWEYPEKMLDERNRTLKKWHESDCFVKQDDSKTIN